MSTNTPSPEWERVVRAVTTSVLTSLHTSWPGIVLVKIAPDGDVHDMDERHSSERTGPPATSNSHQPRSDGVSSRQARQPPPSNQGDSDREHSQGGTASTVSPPQGPASRGHSGSFEREHVQVLRALLASTGEAAQGRGQRAGHGRCNLQRDHPSGKERGTRRASRRCRGSALSVLRRLHAPDTTAPVTSRGTE